MEEKRLIKKKEKAFTDGNQEQLATACNDLGDYYNQQGKYEDAVTEYQQEAKIYQKLGRRLEMAKANRMIGEMYMLLCEFAKALKHINIYLKVVENLGNQIEVQRAYATLGRVHLLNGQSQTDQAAAMKFLKNAEKAFIKSLLICKDLSGQISKIELLDMQARLYLNIGVVKEHMEDFEEAICYLEKAIKIAKSNDIFELLHLCYTSASLLYHCKKNDSKLALRFCNLALEVAKRLPNRTKKECETLILKSEIMIKVGDFQSAKQVLHKAYKLNTPDLNDRKTVIKTLKIVVALCYTLDLLVTTSSEDYSTKKRLYEKMGDGCSLLQNYEKSIDYYLKMLECAEASSVSTKDLIPVYVSLYQTYKDNKQYDHALEYLWKELDLNKNEPVEAFNTLCNIGEVYELQLKPFWTIQDIYQKALEEAKKCSNLKLEKIALVRLVKIHEKYNMESLLDDIREKSMKRGIDLSEIDEDDEDCSDHNTPDIGDDICLDDLTDSNSESEDGGKPLTSRKRGTCLTIKRNNKGETQLHQACISGNLSLARRLIDQGHTVNVRDHAGWLPLHEACNHGYRDIVELLLDRGSASAINDKGGTSCDGITPLYDACSNGFLDVVELLIERGANATLLTDFGDNCLNILDKWRNSVELNSYEQIQYERIRSQLFQQLTKAGVLENTKTSQSPVTNATCSKSSSKDNSLDKLRQLAYSSGSESDHEDIYSIQNTSNSNKSQSNYTDNVSPFKRSSSILNESNAFSSKASSKFNAKNEYKNVMERLKHPNRTDIIGSDEHEQHKKRKSGFLEPDEVDDDWLEDDSDQTRKKRKCLTSRPTTSTGFSSEYSDTLNQNYLSMPISNNPFGLFNEIDNNCQDAFQVLLEPNNKQKVTQNPKSSRAISSKNKTRRTKSQTSLLDSGFSRYRSESPIYNENSSELDSNEPDSTTTNSPAYLEPVNEIPSTIQPTPAAMISFKIKIEDEMLLVPVERNKITGANIRWLAEEASRRYYNLVGLRPVLRLMTADGFAFEESDTISVAQNESMISSKVLEWKISPLAQRYEEMCGQLNASLNLDIKGILEKAQVSNSVPLQDFCLTPETVEPVFKSLVHQATLRALDLSNNFIQNDGCKQLAKALLTLKQLRVLNLEGNCITAEGIRIITSSTCDLPELEELNLSFNPLGSESVAILDKFCKNTQKLKSLKLTSCNINSFYDYDLQFFNLSNFDVSFNIINAESLSKVLKKLNSSKLESLNLSFTVSNYSLGSKLGELLDGGTCESFKIMELAGCQLVDTEIYRIVQNLTKAKNLEYLNMSENPRLTLISLQYILQNLPQLKKILLLQCTQLVTKQFENITLSDDVNVPELIALSLNDTENQLDDENMLKKFWEKYHGDRGKIRYLNNNIYLYNNECDLLHV